MTRAFILVMVSFGLIMAASCWIIWDSMSDRQDITLHRVILSTKTAEIRFGPDGYQPNEESRESQESDAALLPSPNTQVTPEPSE